MAIIKCPKNKTVTNSDECRNCHLEHGFAVSRPLCQKQHNAVVIKESSAMQAPITTPNVVVEVRKPKSRTKGK